MSTNEPRFDKPYNKMTKREKAAVMKFADEQTRPLRHRAASRIALGCFLEGITLAEFLADPQAAMRKLNNHGLFKEPLDHDFAGATGFFRERFDPVSQDLQDRIAAVIDEVFPKTE